MKKPTSEFGKGLVYNLVLFANHFSNRQAQNLGYIYSLIIMPEKDREEILSGSPSTKLNYRKDMEYAIFWYKKLRPFWPSTEEAFSEQITTWANGATDHLYELECPKEWEHTKIAKMIKILKDKGLWMGHGFLSKKTYTMKDFAYLCDLTKKIAIEIDKKLGVTPIKAQWE